MLKVIGMGLLIFGISFFFILRKRGINLYIPTKKTNGKVVNIVTKHRLSREPKRGTNSSQRLMDINEDFAIIEFYNNGKQCIVESMFPILPFDIVVGDNLEIRYSENKNKVYIKKY